MERERDMTGRAEFLRVLERASSPWKTWVGRTTRGRSARTRIDGPHTIRFNGEVVYNEE